MAPSVIKADSTRSAGIPRTRDEAATELPPCIIRRCMESAEQSMQTTGGRRRVLRWLTRVGVAIAVVVACVVLFRVGLDARQRVYESTTRVRHGYDVRHNLLWGLRAIDEGWIDLYGNVIHEAWPSKDYRLDYVPLRLLVMRQWADAARAANPEDRRLHTPVKERNEAAWRPDYAFTRPLLLFNACLEAIGAVAAFLLVRLWVRRSAAEVSPPPWRGCAAGAIAALMYWFSPTSQLSGQAWPSSDVWVPPFFLWAVLLGCWNRWFVAGLVIGVGVMFKGQQMLVAPLFLLWPLFMLRPLAALRWLAGFLFAAAVVVAPWLLRDEASRVYQTTSITWVACVALACVLAIVRQVLLRARLVPLPPGEVRWGPPAQDDSAILSSPASATPTLPPPEGEEPASASRRESRRAMVGVSLLFAIAALLIWPWLDQPRMTLQLGLSAVTLAVTAAWLTPLRWQGHLAAGLLGAGVLALPFLTDADLTWFRIGFQYGAEKFPGVSQFQSSTLAALLEQRFNWHRWDEIVFTAFGHPASLKTTMTSVYGVFLLLAAFAMARYSLRPDCRFLVALTLPWMAAYAFMPQLHGRYLLFPATIGVVLVGVSAGLAMIDVVLIFLAWLAVMHLLLGAQAFRPGVLNDYVGPEWDTAVRHFVRDSLPDTAWAVLLITLVLLHQTFACRRSPGL